jgi:hypothetical protein
MMHLLIKIIKTAWYFHPESRRKIRDLPAISVRVVNPYYYGLDAYYGNLSLH